MAKDTEIEIKVKIEKVKPLLKFLNNKAKLIAETHQIDQYFTPVHRNFIQTRPINEWLRLRVSDGKSSINYKNWHETKDVKTYSCDEFETIVENIDALKKIFKSLDFKSIVEVDKKRQAWRYKDYEISIDSVKNLGNFIEIEYRGNLSSVDPKKIAKDMIKFLKDTGCGKINQNSQGYPFLLLFPKEAKYENQ